MITLNKDSSNIIYVTLTENSRLGTPRYLLKLRNKNNSRDVITRVGNDIAGNNARWNAFVITEVPRVDVDLSAAKVNLAIGQYDYTFYETLDATGVSLSAATVVEVGLLEVIGEAPAKATFDGSITNKITFR